MIYPSNFEEKIGFDIIRDKLKEACLSFAGEKFVQKMKFVSNFATLDLRLNQTNEFRQMIMMEANFPARNFIDMSEALQFLKMEGSTISQEEFFDLMLSLESILAVKEFISKRKESYPKLAELDYQVQFDPHIVIDMQLIMDKKGMIKDNASVALSEIRSKIHQLTASMRNRIQQSLQEAKNNGWTRDDAEITIRNGRAVIPMLAADKRKIKGFIHDESKTGQLVYLEPIELFETNNELRELELDEKQEIARILFEFAQKIKPQIEELLLAYRYLGMIDFIRAKAKVALLLEAVKPIINQTASFNWRDARHPILFLSHQQKNKKVVPLNIGLNELERILIISGPNAGGKSVCLKTVGLLQYMLQCGLLVPMKENSEVRLFDDIFIDIGDEQSIENDLSTYSSHLTNIKNFLQSAQSKSLFLIDEFGAGTEPAIGGAIAEASLEQLNNKKSYGVVTTHYSNLKAMAKEGNGMVNGAMLFDTRELRPLYRLKMGQPGSSFAFEIARKIGLDEGLLSIARKKSGRKEIDLDQQLQEVELEKERNLTKQKELEFTDSALKELVDRYEALNAKLQSEKQSIIHQAKAEAKEVLKSANRLIEKSVRDIKESQAEKETVKLVRQEVEATKQSIEKSLAAEKETPKTKIISTKVKKSQEVKVIQELPKVGDEVRIIGQESVGILEQIKGIIALVSFESLKISVAFEKLEKVKTKQNKSNNRRSNSQYSSILKNIHERSMNFKPNIDIRGMRAEEALSFVKSWIDEAILISQKDLEILHGTGNGILRQIIRDYLSGMREVESYLDAHIDFGGSGKTLIKLH